MDVDPQFQQSRAASKRRKQKRQLQLAGLVSAGALGVAAVVALVFWALNRPDTPDEPDQLAQAEGEVGEQFVQVEDNAAAPAVRLSTPFVDIAGDPMILRFDVSDQGNMTAIVGPPDLDPRRFGSPRPERLRLVVEDLVVQESRLVTALPSSREDFAFFQAQRRQSLEQNQQQQPVSARTGPQTQGELVLVSGDDNSFGEALGGGGGTGSAPLSYIDTRIQNTTSIALVRPEGQRTAVYEDTVVRLERARPLIEVMTSNGFSEAEATRLDGATAELLPDLAAVVTEDGLPPGTIIAIRHRDIDGDQKPLQITFYGRDGYLGTLARRGNLGYIVGGNPWFDEDLQTRTSGLPLSGGQVQDFRLLDAVYSAAIRSGLPTNMVGELIVLLSQAYDLEAVAAPGDKVTFLYAPDRGNGPAQIAFASISGPSGDMPCYVGEKTGQDAGEYACFSPRGQVGGSGGGAFVTPVDGAMSSPYGPRFHPILKEVRLHGGIDWAAPTGTPVVAAQAGQIAYVGLAGGYGNVVYIDHADSLQTRYAHLNAFADGMAKGREVRAGEVIGYVGTTGRSTGPHLHFEFRRNGAPIDPFSLGQGGSLAGSDAVEALTDQIIRVESAGNAEARNARSTATGLGQFIESTWLRMMRDYRPDLHGTMSRPELLALRTDPTLSREMVQNLARENENFLRARGHQIDAGRLYLAHFLGPSGANTVLGADDNLTILEVMGAAVVRANPFLKDYTVADLEAWAQRKMRGTGGSSVPRPPSLSAEIRAYINQIDAILEDEI